jgi:hypothetical protein
VAVVQAVAAIATQGLGDPYTAFVRIAAMAAAMGALLASIGESVGGTSAAGPPASSRSTALGSEDASQSIINSLAILADTYDMENVRLKNIFEEIRDLNNNITGLVTSIVRTGGTNSLGQIVSSTFNPTSAAQQYWEDSGILSWGNDIFGGTISDWMGSAGNWLFGGSTEQTLIESGIEIGNTIIKNILNGATISAKQYALVKTVTDGGLFSGDDIYGSWFYDDLDSSVTRMLTVVFKNLGNSLIYIAQELGTDLQKVYNYVFESTKLNLKDMSTEDINKALSEWISTMSDTAVETLFGDVISQYQKLNEGLLETAIRLISDKETIRAILEMTNQTFSGTTSQFIKFSESLITVAGSLDDLTDAFSTYYDAFFTDAEKQADYKKQLQGVMGSYGYNLPGTRIGYRDIVEGINLSTEAGLKAYYAMLAVAGTADKYYSYLEQAKGNINPANYSTSLEYQRALAGLPKYADGGIASGPMTGYSATLHGTELVVSPRKGYPATVKGESYKELLDEVKSLREEVASMNRNVTTNTAKTANNTEYLETWDSQGLPT